MEKYHHTFYRVVSGENLFQQDPCPIKIVDKQWGRHIETCMRNLLVPIEL